LQRLGAKIIQIDYQDQQRLQRELEQVSVLLVVPENSSNARQEGKNLIRAARQTNVQYVGLFSLVSADQAQQEQQSIRNLRELEQIVQQQFSDNYTILRSSLFSQIFYYMTPIVEGRNQLDLPIQQDRQWSTVDVCEVVEAVYHLSRENGQREGTFLGTLGNENNRLYQFTGNQINTGPQVAEEWSRALRPGRQIQYQQIQPRQLEQYLRGIRDDDRFKTRPPTDDNEEEGCPRRDRPHSLPLGQFLNDEFIRLLIDIFALANQGKLEFKTDDLRNVLGRPPQELREYFLNNRDRFNRLR
ncbi:hypothetical protein BDA99DRAFT_419229, partial [Phascolomyces articulosus]